MASTSDKCDTLQIMHFIGKDSEIYGNNYIKACDTKYLPLKNLPCVYFPFFYEKTEKSINQISKLVPILESYYEKDSTKCDIPSDKIRTNTVSLNIDDLLSKISNIIENYQPYNNKNINYLTYAIYIFWTCILLIVLKYIYIKYVSIYRNIIIGLIVVLLLLCSIWALVITSKYI